MPRERRYVYRYLMYGLIVKLTVTPGRRDEMVGILKQSAAGVPGCLSYVVAQDHSDENILWVTEVWDSAASHDASLLLPPVKSAISRAREIMAGFERIAVTEPIWRAGIPDAQTS